MNLYGKILLFVMLCSSAFAEIRYVSLTGNNVFPYTNWVDAATNLNYALNCSSNNDTVQLSDGVHGLTNHIMVGRRYGEFTNNWLSFVTIQGGTNTELACSTAPYGAIVLVSSGKTVRLNNVLISGKYCYAGAVRSEYARLEINNCVISNCYTGSGVLRGTLIVSNTVIANCRNTASEPSATIWIITAPSTITVYGCTFKDNRSGVCGGIGIANNCKLTVDNTLFLRISSSGNLRVSAIQCGGQVRNSIFAGCEAYNGHYLVAGWGVDRITLSNCTFICNLANENGYGSDYFNCVSFPAQHDYTNHFYCYNIGTPLFADNDYYETLRVYSSLKYGTNFIMGSNGIEGLRLRSPYGTWNNTITSWVTYPQKSPCIDAGNPLSDYSLEPEANGGRLNLGWEGNTPYASKSWQPQYGHKLPDDVRYKAVEVFPVTGGKEKTIPK